MTNSISTEKIAPEILTDWHRRISRFQRAHTRTAALFEKRYIWNGVSIIALTLIAAVLAWADNNYFKLTASGISVIAAVLAGVQTFLRYPQRAERHKNAGAEFGSLRRLIEQQIASNSVDSDESVFVDRTRKKWDLLTKEAPTVPQGICERTRGKETIIGMG